jgi:hypothetical protein
MVHLNDWHRFDPSDRKTYPKVNAAVQVKFEDVMLEEGISVLSAWKAASYFIDPCLAIH